MNEELYYMLSTMFEGLIVILTVVGSIFACIQLRQIKINRRRQFDQARREKTVEMVMYYVRNTKKETRVIEKIVAGFSDEQCQDLYNYTPFQIDEKTKRLLCQICPHKEECQKMSDIKKENCCKKKDNCRFKKGNSYIIDDVTLLFIRGHIISYLNVLECVLLSWQLGIVDQGVIEEQFIFLDKKRQKEQALDTFRTIAGLGKSYPAIEKFYQHLKQKRREEAAKTLRNILQ